MVPPITEPVTVKFVRVPTDVMLGCAAVVTLCAVPTVLTTLAPFIFEIPEPFPESKFACKIPPTVSPVRVPTDVILGWDGFVTLEATLAAATFPTRFEEFRFEIAEPLETTSNPWTLRPVKVPTDVMLGWEGFVTLEATLAAETLPTRLEALTLLNPDAFPESKFACKIPEIFKLVKIPTDVMLG
jgi:hypothetical protein